MLIKLIRTVDLDLFLTVTVKQLLATKSEREVRQPLAADVRNALRNAPVMNGGSHVHHIAHIGLIVLGLRSGKTASLLIASIFCASLSPKQFLLRGPPAPLFVWPGLDCNSIGTNW